MNIFYDNVDANLQAELNARGKAGFHDRTNKSLNFMLAKMANVECIAYEGSGSSSNKINIVEFGTLGGITTQTDRYLPSGPNGFLTTREIDRSEIKFYKSAEDFDYKAALEGNPNSPPKLGEAYIFKSTITDSSKRIGPYLTSIDVTIGDHSMGLLNKATISFMVPNAERDIDNIENTWFHPGRFVAINIQHPDSAIVTQDINGRAGLLLVDTVPNADKLSKLYPGLKNIKDIEAFQNKIRRMNVFTFEGLVTSFNFSYTADGGIEATLQLTGTSNVFADISMYIEGTPQEEASKAAAKAAADKINSNPNLGANNYSISASIDKSGAKINTRVTGSSAGGINSFYSALSDQFNVVAQQYITTHQLTKPLGEANILTQFFNSKEPIKDSSDHYILAGKMYDMSPMAEARKALFAGMGMSPSPESSTIIQNNPVGTYERYITLGALIHFINKTILGVYKSLQITNPETKKPVGITHTEIQEHSNYYERLTSCTPHKILFLPKDPSKSGLGQMNFHGDLGYYRTCVSDKTTSEVKPTKAWPGIHETVSIDRTVMFPSRIFINLQRIEQIANLLGEKNLKTFTISSFLSAISGDILYASGGAISLKLVSDKTDLSNLIFTDTAYLKSNDLTDPKTKIVKAYSVPMFANHPNGSVVRDFTFSAQLPENAKNLSYVLNSGDKVTNDQIAPYMNFMYNSKNPKAINDAIATYKTRHLEILNYLANAKSVNGEYPYSYGMKDSSGVSALYKALSDYIKIPTDDIQKSQQITAPIFPFTVEFTIDGINGLRYGDVLTFDALPKKYRVNTVFSIISVTHGVTNTAVWTTTVKCIMRPSID